MLAWETIFKMQCFSGERQHYASGVPLGDIQLDHWLQKQEWHTVACTLVIEHLPKCWILV